MSKTHAVGKKAIYKNPITGIVANCTIAKEVPEQSNVVPVNILNAKGEVEYENAWVSKENLTFED